MNTIKGIISTIYPTRQVSDNLQVRDFVITTEEQYAQHILLQLMYDNCLWLDSYPIGARIKCYFHIRGRKWENQQGETKYFNTLYCYKIESLEQQAPQPQYHQPQGVLQPIQQVHPVQQVQQVHPVQQNKEAPNGNYYTPPPFDGEMPF